MTIINGKKIAKNILLSQKELIKKHSLKPGLATILIGNDEASKIYINEKCRQSKKIGIKFLNFQFPISISQPKVISLINKLNSDKDVHGIIVQFPIPAHLDADAIIKTIDPKKDADGFHPENIAKFLEIDDFNDALNQDLILPVTPAAIMTILNRICKARLRREVGLYNHIAVIGKCSIFLTPLMHYFQKQIEVINPNDPDLAKKSSQADILIAACGRPKIIKPEMVKPGAIVIDVGISRQANQVVGDVDFKKVAPKTKAITPATGGVGPITVAILLRNVVYNSKS